MSTLREDMRDLPGERGRRVVRAMRALAAVSGLLALAALWSVERADLAHDLQLAAEPSARPGETLALRALLFRNVDAAEGPTLASVPVDVRLRDEAGRELVRVALKATPLDTLDGELRLPSSIAGNFVLEASGELAGRRLQCRRALKVDMNAPARSLRGREAGALQQLAIGRVYEKGAQPPPDRLLVRVAGGACVPDLRCLVLVWVGEPGAALTLRSNDSAELLGAPVPAQETSGLVALAIAVRGPDAEVTLQARRGGELVAERAIRLPVGLGEVALLASRSMVHPTQVSFEYAPPPGREYVIADVFTEGRWRASRVLRGRDADQAHGFSEAFVESGLLRLQAHADRIGAESAGARVFYVQTVGESDAGALSRIAELVAREPLLASGEPTDAWARTLPSFALEDPQRTAAFLLAPLEALRMPVPRAVSGRPAELRGLERTRVRMRFGVAGALVVSALALALSIARRGLHATEQAEAIMDEARGGNAALRQDMRGERLRARAQVVLMVLAVVSAFLAGALLIAAKPLWF